jgi:hypothetical protein
MEPPVQFMDMGQLVQSGGVNQREEEAVMYWRKPRVYIDQLGLENEYNGPGWITTADTQDLKAIKYIRRGWELLAQYGRVIESGGNRWVPILTHSRGPLEFPAEQVKTNLWYRPEHLPGRLRGHPIYFPQLLEAYPEGVPEFLCPDCTRRIPFHEPFHLARHLVMRHQYDRAAILAMEEFFGLPLTRQLRGVRHPFQQVQVPGIEHQQIEAGPPGASPRPVVVQEMRPPSFRKGRATDPEPAAEPAEDEQRRE